MKKSVPLIFLLILGMLLFYKGIELLQFGTNVDGDGIGVAFLGIEMADDLPEQEIPKAAAVFYTAGTSLLLYSFILAFRFRKRAWAEMMNKR
jgi:hypothetical protein